MLSSSKSWFPDFYKETSLGKLVSNEGLLGRGKLAPIDGRGKLVSIDGLCYYEIEPE